MLRFNLSVRRHLRSAGLDVEHADAAGPPASAVAVTLWRIAWFPHRPLPLIALGFVVSPALLAAELLRELAKHPCPAAVLRTVVFGLGDLHGRAGVGPLPRSHPRSRAKPALNLVAASLVVGVECGMLREVNRELSDAKLHPLAYPTLVNSPYLLCVS